MKTLKTLLAAAILSAVFLPASETRAGVSIDFFYSHLDSYGSWVETDDYGYCWHPHGVSDDWRPYSDGHWVYTDAGWTWFSNEPFGWATYHYGRWAFFDGYGWIWVPGTEWAPAWVSWRHGPEYVGWAPLPPEARFVSSIGFSIWVDAYYDIGPRHYSFVDHRHFGSRRLRDHFRDRRDNLTIINNTTNITNITYQNNFVHVGGPKYEELSQRSEEPIRRLKLDRQREFEGDLRGRSAENFQAKVEGDALKIAAPAVEAKAADARPSKVAEKLSKDKLDRGWKGAGSEEEIAQAKEEIKNKAEMPDNLPPRESVGKGKEGEVAAETAKEPGRKADEPPATAEARKQGAKSEQGAEAEAEAKVDTPPATREDKPGAKDRPPSPADEPKPGKSEEEKKEMPKSSSTDRPEPGGKPEEKKGEPDPQVAPRGEREGKPEMKKSERTPSPDQPSEAQRKETEPQQRATPIQPPERKSETRKSDAPRTEEKRPEMKRPEQSPPETRQPEPKRSEQRPPEARQPEPKRSEQRPPEARQPEPKRSEQGPPESKQREVKRPEQGPPESRQRPEPRKSPEAKRPEPKQQKAPPQVEEERKKGQGRGGDDEDKGKGKGRGN